MTRSPTSPVPSRGPTSRSWPAPARTLRPVRCATCGRRWRRHSATWKPRDRTSIVDAGRLGLERIARAAAAMPPTWHCSSAAPRCRRCRRCGPWADALRRPPLDWHQAGVLLVGEGQPYGAREVASVRRPAGGGVTSPTTRSQQRCSPAERHHPNASRPGRSPGRFMLRSPRSTRRSPTVAPNCSKEHSHDVGTHSKDLQPTARRAAAVRPAAPADSSSWARHVPRAAVAHLPTVSNAPIGRTSTGRWSLRCAPKPPSSSARRSPPTAAGSTRPHRRNSAARSCST